MTKKEKTYICHQCQQVIIGRIWDCFGLAICDSCLRKGRIALNPQKTIGVLTNDQT